MIIFMNKSAWWFLLPLIGGILGSAIAWSQIRSSEDKELLQWIMIFGAVQTISISITGLAGAFDPFYNV